MFGETLQYRIENLGLWFQGGVRRSILIFFGVCLLASIPVYFLVGFLSSSWFQASFNPGGYNSDSFVTTKFIPEKPIEIAATQIVDLKDGSRQLYSTISNKLNPQIGYFPFVYELQILDSNNQLIDQKTERSYLLPGEVKYVIWGDNDSRGTKLQIIKSSESQIVYYNPNSPTVRSPDLRVIDTGCRIRGDTSIMYISFRMRNQSRFKVKDVDTIYIVRDSREKIVGIGEYSFVNFETGEGSPIELEYVQPKDFVESRGNITSCNPLIVEVLWSVNYLDTGNFVR